MAWCLFYSLSTQHHTTKIDSLQYSDRDRLTDILYDKATYGRGVKTHARSIQPCAFPSMYFLILSLNKKKQGLENILEKKFAIAA